MVVQTPLTGQQHRRRIEQAALERSDRNLLQILVVDPQLFTVTDDLLFVRRLIVPAKLVGPFDPKTSFRLLDSGAGLVDEQLVEMSRKAIYLGEKSLQALDAAHCRRRGPRNRDSRAHRNQ